MGKIFDALQKASSAANKSSDLEAKSQVIATQEIASSKFQSPNDVQREPATHRSEVARPSQSLTVSELLVSCAHNERPEAMFAAEQFKMLRSQLLFPSDGSVSRTILVTSAVPSEGKSLVAANLAVSIALGRHEHVLLVEADLRRPSLVELFGLKNSRGLTEYLLEKDELSNLLYPTGIEKVTLLPGGGNTNIPSELLSSKRMIGLLKEVKSRYQDRFIIVDSSPAHVAAETEVLGRFIDGVVLVVRYGKSARTFVRQTVEKIGREKFIGVVFNGLEGKQSPGYYYNYLKYYCDSDTKGRSPLCFWRK